MECPHLAANIKITAPPMKTEDLPALWCCAVCNSNKSPWLCLYCGVINCGRYINGHAKEHFEEKQHTVCMDCHSYATYCYTCDEFVINDATLLEDIRDSLRNFVSPQQQNSEIVTRRRNSSEHLENKISKKLKTECGAKKLLKSNVAGLRNLGNTCFMNAVLQSLSNIQQFCYYFKQLPTLDSTLKNGKKLHFSKKNNKGDDEVLLAEELRKTLILLWQGNKSAISPESLFSVIWKVVPRFRGYQQQDAHEFLRYILDRLHIELLNILPYPNSSSPFIGPKGKSTIVTSIFGGMLQSEVQCLICGTESKKHDPFLDLSLDIPSHFIAKCLKGNKEGETTLCKLSDCLTSFTEVEQLADTELYMCGNCKQKQPSTKKFWVRRLPNVLCLHLKRFRWSQYLRTKVDTYIEFPIKGLDMNKFVLSTIHETRGSCSGSNYYDLAAVIVHHGTGAGSGHYTAYATRDKGWYHFNDSTVTISDEETVAKCKAYILFYIQRELELPNFDKGHLKS